jgi:hypothetical protein
MDISNAQVIKCVGHANHPSGDPYALPPLHGTASSHDSSNACISIGAISRPLPPLAHVVPPAHGALYRLWPWAPPGFIIIKDDN